jgi:uncharacterized protein (TIGR03085 family)
VTNWAAVERAGLCATAVATGPDAPTLAEGWTVRDLFAHLIVRERRPDAAPGLILAPLAGYSERVRRSMARRPWPQLVDRVRTGPPLWMPTRIGAVDRLVNTIEFFVHHEDVRRAQSEWSPRSLDPAFDHELWRSLRRIARLMLRRAPMAVTLRRPTAETVVGKRGDLPVTVTGPTGELMLFAFGRQRHARVDIVADDAVTESLREARLGI